MNVLCTLLIHRNIGYESRLHFFSAHTFLRYLLTRFVFSLYLCQIAFVSFIIFIRVTSIPRRTFIFLHQNPVYFVLL